MGRAKKYDRNEVLKKALDVFWDKGFAATGMAELEESLGINKFSIYAEFQSKYGLFIATLDYFAEHYQKPAFEALDHNLGAEGIMAFFERLPLIAEMTGHNGCFLLLAGIEFNHSDRDIQQRIEYLYDLFQAKVLLALKNSPSRANLSDAQLVSKASLIRTYLEGLLSRYRHGGMQSDLTAELAILRTVL